MTTAVPESTVALQALTRAKEALHEAILALRDQHAAADTSEQSPAEHSTESPSVGENGKRAAQATAGGSGGVACDAPATSDPKLVQPPEDTAPTMLEQVRELLRTRGVVLRGHHSAVPADEPLDRLAQDLAHGLHRLGDLPQVLRRAATTQRPQTLRLRDEPAEVVNATTSLATRLLELGLLAHARHDRGGRCLNVRTADAGQPFLAGAWLSRFAALALDEAREQAGLTGRVLRLVDLHLPDGSSARLDALGWTLDGRPLWIQTHSGAYQEHLTRCVQVRRTLQLDPEQCLLVLASVSDPACRELSAIHGLTVTTIQGLEEALASAIGGCGVALVDDVGSGDHRAAAIAIENAADPTNIGEAEAPSGIDGSVSASERDRLAAMLRRCGMRPQPDELVRILRAVAPAFAQRERMTGRELKATVADATGCSRAAVQDVLVALARGGGLIGCDGSRAGGLGAPLAGVAGEHADELVEHCLQAYRTAILAQDPAALGTVGSQRALRALLDSRTA